MLVGRLLATLGVLLCGRWCFGTFCGIYEGKLMIKGLRIVRGF
jgi:hypothetical protein